MCVDNLSPTVNALASDTSVLNRPIVRRVGATHAHHCACLVCLEGKRRTRKVRVYRYELVATGEGPYNSPLPGQIKSKLLKHNGAEQIHRHPSPKNDGLAMSPDWYCGFADLRTLRSWFDEDDRRAMALHGVKLNRYRVPAALIQRGRKQVVFVKAEAELLGEVLL